MLTLVAFVVALALLIAVHEYGHYRVAVACGVKVLRFSVGFGQVVYRWRPRQQRPGQDTEFVLGAFPLGGYVKMLDEREGPVDPAERHLAFNTQPLRARAAIVAAGPCANLLLAIALYALLNWFGVQQPQPILARPLAGSIAQMAGVQGGERVMAVAFDGEALAPVMSFDELRWHLTRAAIDGRNLRLRVQDGQQLLADPEATASESTTNSAPQGRSKARDLTLELSRIEAKEADATLFTKIGLLGPWSRPLMGEIMPGGAADKAQLREGDLVLAVGNTAIVDAQQLRQLIRESIYGPHAQPPSLWRVQRQGQEIQLLVAAEPRMENGAWVGRIGAFVGALPAMVTVRYGPLDGLWRGVQRTWEVSVLTLNVMGRMVIGEASLKNLSGPLSIADYAGKSASMGLSAYVVFLALISVSLGVLNLLPVPVLDGGHLMYYLWEALTGKSVSDAWMENLQRAGMALLLVMMSIAMFNDVARYWADFSRFFG